MRQHHVAREKAFVDYSGKRIGIVDPTTGEVREAEIFVGVLGALNLTYAEATWTQQLPDWTGAHVRMFRFFGGAPKLLVPDNLKSGVAKASFYDPEINRTYGAFACHVFSGDFARATLQAHSGDLERLIRSIMNTDSGDHEHPLALAERALASGTPSRWGCDPEARARADPRAGAGLRDQGLRP